MTEQLLLILGIVFASAGAILAVWSITVSRQCGELEEAYDDWWSPDDLLTPTPRAHLHRHALRPVKKPWSGRSLGRKHHIRPRR